MSYITTAEFTEYTGIPVTASNQDRVEALIASTKSILDAMIGDLTLGSKEQFIYEYEIFQANAYWKMTTNILQIQSVTTLDGNAYTGTFKVLGKLKNILYLDTLTDAELGLGGIELVVNAGYSTIPHDIKLLQANMVALELSTDGAKEIKQYKLGPRTVTYADNAQNSSRLTDINSILNLYTIHHV